ncbi:MAG: DNA mismatch repair protein MutS, partial [Phycisphaerae bacterium]|nr:DNA mismatch repair protein MutS [Phycisphaerae bacterium]
MTREGTKPKCQPPAEGLTPAMRQYIEQKAAAPDALLLFRMGDFYETFYDDAITAARVLGITLTTRGKDRNGQAVPLAGIPYHALEGYLTKLVRAGIKVAISEQLEDPKLAKGVVKRDIVRIVTPGTLTDDALLERKADNYLACLHYRRDETGLACVELSTGAFWVQTVAEKELLNELVRLAPAELILAEVPIDARDPLAHVVKELTGPNPLIPSLLVTRRPAHVFDPYQADQRLRQHFGVATLEGFGFDRIDASLSAAAAIIDYLSETQKGSLNHIVKLTRREPRDFVLIDQSTWRALEIERTIRGGSASGSLLQSVDRTSTPMGARCLRRWLAAPLRDAKRIRERQQAIADLLADLHLLQAVRNEMGKLADIERITARLGVGRASPRDLLALGSTLLSVEKIAATLDRLAAATSITGEQLCPFLADRCDVLRGEHDLAAFLTTSLHPNAPLVLNEGGIIADGYDAELDRLRTMGTNAQQWLADYQAREIQRSGINSLKVGYNQVFGYYIEITHAHAARIPPDYVRKQTLKNAERYITDELKQYETEILTARDRAFAREQELFEVIRQRAVERIAPLQQLAAAISEIDVTAGLAHLADERRYVRPEMVEGNVLEISEGRHPVLEQALAEKFVPNDCRLGAVSDQRSAVSGQQSAVSGQRSAVSQTTCATSGQSAISQTDSAAIRPDSVGLFGPQADLKSEISDFKSQMSDLKSETSNRQSGVSDLKSEIPNLRSEIPNLRSEISNLKPQISNLRSETVAILTGPNMAGKSTYI